jgi:hypothetical protein
MTGELVALGLTLVVHLLGAAVLVLFIARSTGADLWGWWPGDDDGRGPEPKPSSPAPRDDGLPLPDAVPAARRLREPERLADAYPRPSRRPAHPEPARAPERERQP